MPRVGTGYTNLSTLLDLNRPDIERMAGDVGRAVDGESRKAQAGLDGAYDKWAAQATYSGPGWEDWLSKNGGGDVEQGLQSAQMAQNYQGSSAGREALVKKTYGGGGALDAALLGGAGGARFATRAAAAPVAGQNPALAQKSQAAGEHTARLQQIHGDAVRAQAEASRAGIEKNRQETAAQAPDLKRERVSRRNNPYNP